MFFSGKLPKHTTDGKSEKSQGRTTLYYPCAKATKMIIFNDGENSKQKPVAIFPDVAAPYAIGTDMFGSWPGR